MADSPVVTITVRPNGSYRVEGPIRLVDGDGNEWDLTGRAKISLCRCGASNTKPFCDGTHRTIGFQAAETAPKAENSFQAAETAPQPANSFQAAEVASKPAN